MEEIKTWNAGRFHHQVFVFEITVDLPSELYGRLLRDIERWGT